MSNWPDPNQPSQGQWGPQGQPPQSQPNQGQWGQWGQQGQGQWGQQGQGQWGQQSHPPQQPGPYGQGQWGPPPVSMGGGPQQGYQPGLIGSYERGVDRAVAKVDKVLTCGEMVYSGCFLIVINLFMLGFLGLSYYFLSGSLHLARNGTPTTGVVVDFEEHSSSDGVTWSPIVEFKVGRKTYEFESGSSSSPKAYDVGEEVPILYDPEDPETAEIKSWMSSPGLFAGVFGIQLLALLVINVVAIRRMWRGQPIDDE